MAIYSMSRRELLKEISGWMNGLDDNQQLKVKIISDYSLDKTFILNIFEEQKK